MEVIIVHVVGTAQQLDNGSLEQSTFAFSPISLAQVSSYNGRSGKLRLLGFSR